MDWCLLESFFFILRTNMILRRPKINRIVASQKLYYFGTFKSIMLLYPLCYNNWLKISYLTFCFCAISGWFSGLEKKFEQISIHQKNETIFILFLLAFREFFFCLLMVRVIQLFSRRFWRRNEKTLRNPNFLCALENIFNVCVWVVINCTKHPKK